MILPKVANKLNDTVERYLHNNEKEIKHSGYIVSKFISLTENIAVDATDNVINRELLKEIIASIIYVEEFSYESKIIESKILLFIIK